MDRCVLPVPGGPKNTTFSLASTKSSAEMADGLALEAALVVVVEVLEALAGREAGRFDPGFATVVLAGGDLAFETGGQELLVAPGLSPGPLCEPVDRGGQRGRLERSAQIGEVGLGLGGHHATPVARS